MQIDTQDFGQSDLKQRSVIKNGNLNISKVGTTDPVNEFDREVSSERIQKRSSPRTSQLLSNAVLLMNAEDFRLAEGLLHEALRTEGVDTRALELIARCAKFRGDLEGERKFLAVLCEVDPSPEHHFLFAECQERLDDLIGARESLQMAMKTMTEETPVLFSIFKNLGNLSLKEGDFEAAEEFYNKAFTMHPESDDLMVNMGSLEIIRGDLPKALERFRHAVELNSNHSKAWLGLATIHRSYGDHELSWANLDRSLDIRPMNRTAVETLVEWAMKEARAPKCLSILESYMEEFPNDLEMNLLYSKVLLLTGQPQLARLEVEKVLAFDPHLQGGVEFLAQLKSLSSSVESEHEAREGIF